MMIMESCRLMIHHGVTMKMKKPHNRVRKDQIMVYDHFQNPEGGK